MVPDVGKLSDHGIAVKIRSEIIVLEKTKLAVDCSYLYTWIDTQLTTIAL